MTMTVFFTPAREGQCPRTIDEAIAGADGVLRGRYSGKTAAELAEQYEQPIEHADLEAFHALHEASLRTEPTEITRDAFYAALEVLPPEDWEMVDGIESFKMSERYSGRITTIYAAAHGRRRYWQFLDRYDMPARDVAGKIRAILNAEARRRYKPKTVSTRGVNDSVQRYRLIVEWAWNRYAEWGTTCGGSIKVRIGKQATKYALIEDAAGARYLGARRLYPRGTKPAGA